MLEKRSESVECSGWGIRGGCVGEGGALCNRRRCRPVDAFSWQSWNSQSANIVGALAHWAGLDIYLPLGVDEINPQRSATELKLSPFFIEQKKRKRLITKSKLEKKKKSCVMQYSLLSFFYSGSANMFAPGCWCIHPPSLCTLTCLWLLEDMRVTRHGSFTRQLKLTRRSQTEASKCNR